MNVKELSPSPDTRTESLSLAFCDDKSTHEVPPAMASHPGTKNRDHLATQNRQTDRQTDRQAGRQAGRQTHNPKNTERSADTEGKHYSRIL